MTTLTHRASRLVWAWCVAYTAVAPGDRRDRRRGEIRSHLWESEAARLPGSAVLFAAFRGLLDDVGWAVTTGLPRLGRSFGTPTPYIVLAPAFPLQAWVVSATTVGAVAHLSETLGAAGGGLMLVLAGRVWLVRRGWGRRPGA
jgi:hypothetical protein